jgi:hypothetical protein
VKYVILVSVASIVGTPVGLFLGTPVVLALRRGVSSLAEREASDDDDVPSPSEARLWGLGMALGVGATIATLHWIDDVGWGALGWPAIVGALAAGASWTRFARRGMAGASALPFLMVCAAASALAAGAAAAIAGR